MACKTEGGIKGNSAYKTVEDESEIANETQGKNVESMMIRLIRQIFYR